MLSTVVALQGLVCFHGQLIRLEPAGRSGSLTFGSLSIYGSATSPGMTTQSSNASLDSDDDDLPSPNYDTVEVQEIFTELLEIFDESAPSSQQQQRAMNNLWSFYAAHADELEACAPELEAMLCNRHVSAQGQTPFPRVSTSPSDVSQRKQDRSTINSSDCTSAARWNFLHRRSRSMT